MYNLTVDTAHTFFVGEGQWLVHNACGPKGNSWLTEEQFWQKRHQYVNEILAIPGQAINKMRNEGFRFSEAAEWAVQKRLEIGKNYKDLMPSEMLEATFTRNMKEYGGNPWGPPNADWLRENKGYSTYQIIQASGRPGGGNIISQLLDIGDRLYWK
jgi:hypothetical protein